MAKNNKIITIKFLYLAIQIVTKESEIVYNKIKI